jgi:hypothetical protein
VLSVAELEQMLQDTGGVAVLLGDQSTWGHFEIMDEVVLSDTEVLVAAPTVLVATGRIPTGFAIGDPIMVGTEDWFNRDHRRIDEGGLTRILLRRV